MPASTITDLAHLLRPIFVCDFCEKRPKWRWIGIGENDEIVWAYACDDHKANYEALEEK